MQNTTEYKKAETEKRTKERQSDRRKLMDAGTDEREGERTENGPIGRPALAFSSLTCIRGKLWAEC